jgi:hypothetical protein
MSYKIISLKNLKYVELENIIESLESFRYEHKDNGAIFNTDGFYISMTNKVLVVYDETMLKDTKVRELLLEYLI